MPAPITPEGASPVHRTTFDPEADRASTAVVRAITTAGDVGPAEIEPLYGTIEPEALDRLFAHAARTANGPSSVFGFAIDGWTIFVHGDGRIDVYDRDSDEFESAGGPSSEPDAGIDADEPISDLGTGAVPDVESDADEPDRGADVSG